MGQWEGSSRGGGIYVCLQLILAVVEKKLTHCKVIILQLKNKHDKIKVALLDALPPCLCYFHFSLFLLPFQKVHT